MTPKDLLQVAQDARKKAYAPYSKFYVGAALLTSSSKVFDGCNVENASYGLSNCAERTALFTAIAAGEHEFEHLVVATENGVSPCGACRQVIWELCGDIPVTIIDESGNKTETRSSELLPFAFDQADLK